MEKKNKDALPESPSPGIAQHEDAVLKASMQFFAEEILPYFKIEGKVVSFGPTEIVQLELHKQFQDFNFIMDSGVWKHFEFQSTNEGLKGLKRFRNYEASVSYQYNVIVETYVVFSGNIKNPMTEFSEGFNTYKVHPIILQRHNADILLTKLKEKQTRGETITREDLISLVLSPLMAGDTSIKDRITTAYGILKKAKDINKTDGAKAEAMLYAFADKFLDAVDLEKLKEEISMTRLGQMIWEDGKAEGRESTLLELIKDGILTAKEAATRLNITEEEVEKLIEEKHLLTHN